MGLAAFNRMRRDQAEKAKKAEIDTQQNSAEPAKAASKAKAKTKPEPTEAS